MKLKNVSTLFAILVIALLTFGNYQLQENVQEEFVMDGGKFITSELAQTQSVYFETLFGEERILEILNQKEVEGLRIYKTAKGVLLVGTDADGYDVTERFLSFGKKEVGGRSMLMKEELAPVAAL